MITFTIKGVNEPAEGKLFNVIWWPKGYPEPLGQIYSLDKLDVTFTDVPETGALYIYAHSAAPPDVWWIKEHEVHYHGLGALTLESKTYYYDYKTSKLQTWWQVYGSWVIGIGAVAVVAIAFLQKK